LLRGGLDWEILLGQARTHGTLPLLHEHLQRQGWEAVPAPTREALREEFRHNTARNLWRTGELLRLLERLRARGIPALPFKGPTLAAYAYGSVALRQFNDLDLLLRPRDVAGAQEVLLAEGYTPGLEFSAARQAEYLRVIGQVPFARREDGSLVELHARLMPRHFHFPLGLEELWGRAETLTLLGRAVPVLSAEDLLLVLSAHGAKHVFASLGWVSDLAALLHNRPPDLGQALGRARRLRCERLVLLGLRLGYDLLQAPPQKALPVRLRADPVAGALASQVWRGFRSGSRPGELRGALFHLRLWENFADGFGFVLSTMLQPIIADWVFFPLPAALSFLYYFLRPLRLAGKYGARLLNGCWRLLRRLSERG
jgi:hypothetical protein